MKGMLEIRQQFRVRQNWYACHPVQHGDLVLYQYTSTKEPVVRIVAGIPGDHFQLVENQLPGNWNIEVNGELYHDKDSPHFFGRSGIAPTLSLFEKRGALKAGELILFSSVSPGSNDIGLFGLANIEDDIGKVEPIRSAAE